MLWQPVCRRRGASIWGSGSLVVTSWRKVPAGSSRKTVTHVHLVRTMKAFWPQSFITTKQSQ